ncbi:MAG: phosphatidylglycerophosphatase A [Desulfovibrio sp.]|nr:phosphatidylglycerophosphatase A [Desulfovibrio sp.]
MFEAYQKNSPKQRLRLDVRFVLAHPAHLIATFFGSGLLRPASGTWGTLAGWLFYLFFAQAFAAWFWLALIVGVFFLGAWACEIAGRHCGVHDHSSFVIDEVFAIWLVLLITPKTLGWQLAAFVAFRFFDIVKLPPASFFDREMHNGFGVMLDDAFAAFYAVMLITGLCWLLGA